MGYARHYGLSEGDEVTYPRPGGGTERAVVVEKSLTDNNRVFLRTLDEEGRPVGRVWPAVAEWCAKVSR